MNIGLPMPIPKVQRIIIPNKKHNKINLKKEVIYLAVSAFLEVYIPSGQKQAHTVDIDGNFDAEWGVEVNAVNPPKRRLIGLEI